MAAATDPPPDLDVRFSEQGTTRTISAIGEIDLASAPVIDAAVSAALADRPEILVLDLGEVTFMDSTAVQLVLDTQRRAEAAGVRFVALPAGEAVQQVFALCGLEEHLRFVPQTSVTQA